ncbi:hypothetical protein ACFLW0_06480 [Chloroflexota bacterium]
MVVNELRAIPISERQRFENLLRVQAQRYSLSPEDYLRKVWYHEEASKFGEYMAMSLLEQLLPLVPMYTEETEQEAGEV